MLLDEPSCWVLVSSHCLWTVVRTSRRFASQCRSFDLPYGPEKPERALADFQMLPSAPGSALAASVLYGCQRKPPCLGSFRSSRGAAPFLYPSNVRGMALQPRSLSFSEASELQTVGESSSPARMHTIRLLPRQATAAPLSRMVCGKNRLQLQRLDASDAPEGCHQGPLQLQSFDMAVLPTIPRKIRAARMQKSTICPQSEAYASP